MREKWSKNDVEVAVPSSLFIIVYEICSSVPFRSPWMSLQTGSLKMSGKLFDSRWAWWFSDCSASR